MYTSYAWAICMQIPQKLPRGPRSLGNYIMWPPVHKKLLMSAHCMCDFLRMQIST